MIALYIHIPFCAKKCKYCDFASYEGALCYADKYIDALLAEAKQYSGEAVSSVFVGGGTPSLLSSFQISRLVEGINAVFDMGNCSEFTLEANPDSITKEKLQTYNSLGINRLSVGLQTPNDDELKMLGRIHDFYTFDRAFNMARNYFNNINVDIISGLPGQNVEKHLCNLKRVVEYKPEHLSVYSLIPEAGTPLYNEIESGKLVLPDDETDREIYHTTNNFLSNCGYDRYEISNHAQKGYECKHNICYWTGGNYLGIGSAAHSLINGVRFSHNGTIEQYISDPCSVFCEKLSDSDRYEEFIMLRLRMKSGIDFNEFRNLFKYDLLKEKFQQIDFLVKNGLANLSNGRLFLTDKGFDLCDSVILKLL